MRAVWIFCLAAGLAACGSGDDASTADRGASPEPMTPTAQRPLSDEERAVILASLPLPYSEADTENGRRVFARCRSCHTLPEGGPNMTGPNLWGVFGRQAGSVEGYNYSPALREADFAWTAEQLDEWLNNPRSFLPGNKMAFAGVRDETDRRDLIGWLKLETGYSPEA
ncbi:c-type cytochrome [Brevundimonas sp.]|uniref:c-type cytochrome n=1 Tax=Brevundimonas sp. TaxID=1871086 RepID=UPI00391892B5